MSLISYIEKLRTKPESDRKKIAISTAFAVTGIIFIIWAFTIVSSISHRASTEVVTDVSDSASVYGELKASWNTLVDNVSDLFSDPATTSSPSTDESLYFDALEGIPADVVEIDTTGGSLEPTVSE